MKDGSDPKDSSAERSAGQPAYEDGDLADELDASKLSPKGIRQLISNLTAYQKELQAQDTELRKTRSALEDARDNYRTLYDLTPVAYVTLDGTGMILEANLKAASLLAMDRTTLIRKGLPSFLFEQDLEVFFRHQKSVFENLEYHACEIRLKRHEAGPTYVRIESRPFGDQNETPSRCLTVMWDITESKSIENALRLTLGELELSCRETGALLQGTKALLEPGTFRESARRHLAACKELIGATAGYLVILSDDQQQGEVLFVEAEGHNGSISPGIVMRIEGLGEVACQSDWAVYENDLANSKWKEFMLVGPVPLDDVLVAPLIIDRKAAGLLCIANKPEDFTRHDAALAEAFAEFLAISLRTSRTLESLEQSEERMRLLIEAAPVGIRIATDGVYTYVNPAFVKMFGFDHPDEILGRPIETVYGPEDGPYIRRRGENRAAGVPIPTHYQATGVRKTGERFELEAWGTEIRYTGKQSSLGFIVDVSEAKSLRSQLLQAQKMEAIGTLAGGIAHDFNNLLTVVAGYSELLLADGMCSGTDVEDLQKINSAARKGAELVKRLLTFSRKTEMNPRPLNLNHQIEQVRKLLERTIPKMIRIRLTLEPKLGIVSADPTQVEQVLMNLAVNAKDAMPSGGDLTIETKNVVLDDAYGRAHIGAKCGRHVLLSVSDSGQGMDEEILQHIFEPFYTTKVPGKGTGLGLAMVYGIINQHGGFITCDSSPGQGATFRIYFPLLEVETKEIHMEERSPNPRGTETILMVDDEEVVRDLGARILTRAGYTVLTAVNGREGLELYKKDHDRISLVILDLMMPEMGGHQCFEEIMKIDPQAKVLIASGYSSGGTAKISEQLGAGGFIPKPFNVSAMLHAVRDALDK